MSVSILMYHEISKSGVREHAYAVSAKEFEKQLEFIKSNGYHPILLEEYIGKFSGQGPIGKHQFIITFDDSHISNYTTAFPLLKEYGFTANFFVATKFIGKGKDLLNVNQIRDMSENGMSIQSHTHTHAFLSDLCPKDIFFELKTSKDILEDILNKEIDFLSCPGGRYSRTALNIAREVGYKGVCVSSPDLKIINKNIDIFGRFLIAWNTDLTVFEKIIKRDPIFVMRKKAESAIKNSIKSFLGNRLYHNLWKLSKKNKL